MDLLVGTYTRDGGEPLGQGEGIYSVSFNPVTRSFSAPVLRMKTTNVSAMTIDRDRGIVFGARETFAADAPGVSAFQLAPDGGLHLRAAATVTGELPCHLAFDPTHRRLASAQYWTGDVALFDTVGGLTGLSSLTRSGTGPNPDRQEGPHAHCVGFTDGGDVLHVADLGTDRFVSRRLANDGSSVESREAELPPGAGPRHFVVNAAETVACLVCELSEELAIFDRDGLGWTLREISAGFECPTEVEGSTAAIRLSPDARHVYLSGRRQSRIAAFSVEGGLRRIGDYATGGACPREFILSVDGHWAICANQTSGTLTALPRDTGSGALGAPVANCAVPSPVALLQL